MRVALRVIGTLLMVLGVLALFGAEQQRRLEERAPEIMARQEEQVRAGLRPPSDVSSRSAGPYIGPIGANSPAALSIRGALCLVAGLGILFHRRWAMLLGAALLLLFVLVTGAVDGLLHQLRQGRQPGSFAVIGVPMYVLAIGVPTVGSIVLLWAAVAKRADSRSAG